MNSSDEINKPSLTQRSKSGISRITTQNSQNIGNVKLNLNKPKKISTKIQNGSDDISLGKVLLVIIAVVVVAIIAALLVQQLQSSSIEDKQKDTDQGVTQTVTPMPTIKPTSTPTVSSTPTPTVIPTVTPTPGTSLGDVLDNNWGQTIQYIKTAATGKSIRADTIQWEYTHTYFEMNLPGTAVSGSVNIPNANASYDEDGKIKFEIENIYSMVACAATAANPTALSMYNINSVTCQKVGDKYVYTIDVDSKVDFKLTTGKREIPNKGEYDALILQVKMR